MERRETRAGDWIAGDVNLDDPSMRAVMALSPTAGVGDRHHVVPRFLLERFAKAGQLMVRDLVTGRSQLRAVSDMAIKNFYTAVIDVDHTDDGSPERIFDGRIEKAFAVAERPRRCLPMSPSRERA